MPHRQLGFHPFARQLFLWGIISLYIYFSYTFHKTPIFVRILQTWVTSVSLCLTYMESIISIYAYVSFLRYAICAFYVFLYIVCTYSMISMNTSLHIHTHRERIICLYIFSYIGVLYAMA